MLLSLLFAVDLTIEQRVLYRLAANVQSKCSDRECIFDRKDLLAQSQSNSHECPIPRLAKRASLGQLVTITLAMISSFSNVVPCPKYLEDPYANSNSDRHYVYDPYSNEFQRIQSILIFLTLLKWINQMAYFVRVFIQKETHLATTDI